MNTTIETPAAPVVVQPIVVAVSPDTAFVVSDYPYGSLRCTIKFWIDFKPKKGFRFVSQTQNPKNGVWNKPKAGTYVLLGMAMFLDEKNHVTHTAVSEYSSAKQVLEFIKNFPKAVTKDLRVFCLMKIAYLSKKIAGEMRWSINGQTCVYSDAEKANDEIEKSEWLTCLFNLRNLPEATILEKVTYRVLTNSKTPLD